MQRIVLLLLVCLLSLSSCIRPERLGKHDYSSKGHYGCCIYPQGPIYYTITESDTGHTWESGETPEFDNGLWFYDSQGNLHVLQGKVIVDQHTK